MLQVCSLQVLLAVLLGLTAAAKLDGLTPHHDHDHDHDHHHEGHHPVDQARAHGDTVDDNQVPVWNPSNIYKPSHSGAGKAISGPLEERFNIQAGSIRHREFLEPKPSDATAVRGSYS